MFFNHPSWKDLKDSRTSLVAFIQFAWQPICGQSEAQLNRCGTFGATTFSGKLEIVVAKTRIIATAAEANEYLTSFRGPWDLKNSLAGYVCIVTALGEAIYAFHSTLVADRATVLGTARRVMDGFVYSN